MARVIDQTTKKEVKIGDEVTDFRGDKAILCGFTIPQSLGSSGRVTVQNGFVQRQYFPNVYNLVIVE